MANATETTTLPATWAALQAALGQRLPVHVRYHGRQRLICPHALGWRNQRALVLGYQVGGQTSAGTLDPDPRKRWRCMFIDEIELVTADHTAQWQTPDNYNPARPFNAAVEITLAIDDNPASTTSAAAG